MRLVRQAAFLSAVLTAAVVSAQQQGDFRVTLISAEKNVQHPDRSWTAKDVPFDVPGGWSVEKKTLRGGRQEGVQLVTLDNGSLAVTVIPTRGLSILDVRQGTFRFGWESPVQEVVHPKFINLTSRGGLGWLEGFNELMVRCGLEYAGHPGRDEFIDNTGARAEMNLTLHGKIGNIPASEVALVVDRKAPHRLRLVGTVYEKMFFGPKLQLATDLSMEVGSSSFRLEDAITNTGAGPQEIQLLYHTNFGAPLLEKGAEVVAPIREVAPMNARASQGIANWTSYAGPTAGYIEQVYLVHPYADDNGRTGTVLKNAAGDRAASLRWSAEQLPYLTVWKNTTSREDGYVTGLEPGTCFPYNRKVERKFGRVPKIPAGQTRRFAIEFGFHAGRESVARAVAAMRTIQGKRKTTVHEKPPEIAE